MSDLCDLWGTLATIESQMPIKLTNGSTVERISVSCADCKVPCTREDQRGEIEIVSFGAKVKMLNRCLLCGKFNFMSGDVLMDNGSWYLAFPRPGAPMVNPWSGEIYPLRNMG